MKPVSIVLVALFVEAIAAQVPAKTSASIQGVILSSESASPLGKATVELRDLAGSATLAQTRTAADGRFFLNSLPSGQFRLIATRDGYVKSEYGQRPNGPLASFTLTAGESISNIRIVMTKGSVISGRVTDKGKPVGIADVVALKESYVDGQLAFTEILSAKTDDLGDYHIFWLQPGKYHVVAMVWDDAVQTLPIFVTPDGPAIGSDYLSRRRLRSVLTRAIGSGAAENEAHVPVYFPGTTDSQSAAVIDVRPDSDVRSIDIDASPLPIRHIRGRVTGMPATPVAAPVNGGPLNRAGPFVVAFPLGTRLAATERIFTLSTTAEANGAFDIARVPAGRYELLAGMEGLVSVATTDPRIGRISVEMRGQDLDVLIPMSPMITVNGRVHFEAVQAGVQPPNPKDLSVLFRMVIPESRSVQVQPNGAFKQDGLIAWDYSVLVYPLMTAAGSAPAALPPALQNAYVKSIRMGETDVLNGGLRLAGQTQEPLEIVIGMNAGSIGGHVASPSGQPASFTWVALIPDGGQRFRINHHFTSTDASGRYELSGIAPGDYQVFAWEDAEKGSWQDPSFIRDYAGKGIPVHVSEGARAPVDLPLLPAR